MEILKTLNSIFAQVLENKNLILSNESNFMDIEGWSSLNHLLLIEEIEKYFNIKFKVFELMNFYKIQDIIDAINDKIN